MSDASPPAEQTFAVLLRRFREARMLTQEDLAERARVSAKAIGALERGERRRPHPHTVRSLTEALELDSGDAAALSAAVPRDSAAAPPVDPSMPTPMTSGPVGAPSTLFGREALLEQVVDLARTAGGRVVSLTGPGGVGKTRLALEAASRLSEELDDPATVVDLTALRDPALVLVRTAQALGLPDVAGDSVAQAIAALVVSRRTVVVLDNLEHLLGCAPAVADLLQRCPDLVVLATSRAPLRIRAEHEVTVPPLEVPSSDVEVDVAGLARVPAVEMLLDRLAAAGNAVELTDETSPVITAICRRLDGLPLALELAAAASRTLTPAALLDRLDEALGASRIRDLPERQRTMRATLAWSHELLDERARRLFSELAVFSGSFSLDAVESVAGPDDVIDPLSDLVDQSLVVRAPSDGREPRFRLLEPVRQYAAEALQIGGSAGRAADRHAAHFRSVATRARSALRGDDLSACLDELDRDHANVRSAVLRLMETDRPDDAAALLWDIWLQLAFRGHVREALGWLEQVRAARLGDEARTRAHGTTAGLLYVAGDIELMADHADAALALARRFDDDLLLDSTILAGSAALFAGQLDRARPILTEGFDHAESVSATWAATHLVIARGQLALLEGDIEAAGVLLVDAESRARRLGNAFTLSTALNVRAIITELAGDHLVTVELLAEATELSIAARISWTLGYSLPALAGVAARLGQPDVAARLFGASASLSASTSVEPTFPTSTELSARDLTTVRDQLGDHDFRRSWELGRRATLAELAELASELKRLAHA